MEEALPTKSRARSVSQSIVRRVASLSPTRRRKRHQSRGPPPPLPISHLPEHRAALYPINKTILQRPVIPQERRRARTPRRARKGNAFGQSKALNKSRSSSAEPATVRGMIRRISSDGVRGLITDVHRTVRVQEKVRTSLLRLAGMSEVAQGQKTVKATDSDTVLEIQKRIAEILQDKSEDSVSEVQVPEKRTGWRKRLSASLGPPRRSGSTKRDAKHDTQVLAEKHEYQGAPESKHIALVPSKDSNNDVPANVSLADNSSVAKVETEVEIPSDSKSLEPYPASKKSIPSESFTLKDSMETRKARVISSRKRPKVPPKPDKYRSKSINRIAEKTNPDCISINDQSFEDDAKLKILVSPSDRGYSVENRNSGACLRSVDEDGIEESVLPSILHRAPLYNKTEMKTSETTILDIGGRVLCSSDTVDGVMAVGSTLGVVMILDCTGNIIATVKASDDMIIGCQLSSNNTLVVLGRDRVLRVYKLVRSLNPGAIKIAIRLSQRCEVQTPISGRTYVLCSPDSNGILIGGRRLPMHVLYTSIWGNSLRLVDVDFVNSVYAAAWGPKYVAWASPLGIILYDHATDTHLLGLEVLDSNTTHDTIHLLWISPTKLVIAWNTSIQVIEFSSTCECITSKKIAHYTHSHPIYGVVECKMQLLLLCITPRPTLTLVAFHRQVVKSSEEHWKSSENPLDSSFSISLLHESMPVHTPSVSGTVVSSYPLEYFKPIRQCSLRVVSLLHSDSLYSYQVLLNNTLHCVRVCDREDTLRAMIRRLRFSEALEYIRTHWQDPFEEECTVLEEYASYLLSLGNTRTAIGTIQSLFPDSQPHWEYLTKLFIRQDLILEFAKEMPPGMPIIVYRRVSEAISRCDMKAYRALEELWPLDYFGTTT